MYKSAAIYIAKCVVFVAVFWLSYFLLISPLKSQSDSVSQKESNEQRSASQQAMQNYSDQLKKSEQMLDKQAELLGRWEKIIEQWEVLARNSAR